ncbi:MAG: response regulator [Xanthobacteraceae bacterium]
MDALAPDLKMLMARSNILIVDDEYYTRKVIRALLLTLGCTRIFEASDGATGLDAIRTSEPDVILLDWEMPEIDGDEFVRRARSAGAFAGRDVPIIMLAGHDEQSRVLEAMRWGVHEFLLKPVSRNALQARILSVLARSGSMLKHRDGHGAEPSRRSSDKLNRESGARAASAPAAARVAGTTRARSR